MYTKALLAGILRLLHISLVLSRRHVIRNTPRLKQQGYPADIDLGEVIAEAVVESREECAALCETRTACRSVMLVGQLCRMFAPSTCPCFAEFTHIAGSSRYLIGEDASARTFGGAMEKCLSFGAHSVHINSREEHEMIKEYIRNSGVTCRNIWTGGRSAVASSTDVTDWRWYYSNDFTAASEPFTYLKYAAGQPNSLRNQYYMTLENSNDYDFNDLIETGWGTSCFLCECN